MVSLPIIQPPAIVVISPDITIVPADVVAELIAWLDAKAEQEREEAEALIEQMDEAERDEDRGGFRLGTTL